MLYLVNTNRFLFFPLIGAFKIKHWILASLSEDIKMLEWKKLITWNHSSWMCTARCTHPLDIHPPPQFHKWPGTRDTHTHPGKGHGTKDTPFPPLVDKMTCRCLWKQYLSATSLADGKNKPLFLNSKRHLSIEWCPRTWPGQLYTILYCMSYVWGVAGLWTRVAGHGPERTWFA